MNLQNVKQKLDKINRFYTYLEGNEGEVSNIDKDSLLAYIRALYDACLDGASEKEVVVVEKIVEKIVKKIVEVPVEKKTEEPETEHKKRPKLVFNTATEETTAKVEQPVVKEEPKVVVVKEEIKPNPVVEKVAEKVVEKVAEKVVETTPDNDVPNEEYEELFLFKTATDISQKLSEARIEDLTKALGLNEKFLYINELFGGDVAKFQAAIKLLNDAKSFDTARAFIEKDLVEQYKWLDKLKKPVAKDFVKLVRRRYL